MLEEPLPYASEFGLVVIDVRGHTLPTCLEELRTRHNAVASMTLRVSWVPSWT